MYEPTKVALPGVVAVPVKSGWYAKINWTQLVAGAAMVIAFVTGNKLQLDTNTQSAIIIVIGFIGQLTTFVMRTWFNGTVSASSLPVVVDKPLTVVSVPKADIPSDVVQPAT